MTFCWASDATGNSKNLPSLYILLTLDRIHFKAQEWFLKQRRQRYHPRGMVCSTSLLSFSVLGLVSFIEWGGQIFGEVAQPKSSHEKTGVRINSLAVRPLLAFIVFCAVISLGSDFASPPPSIFLHGFPSVLALDTLFPLSSSLFPHKCLDLRISMRCSTSYFLSLHQILARNSMLIHSSLPPCTQHPGSVLPEMLRPYTCYLHDHVSKFSSPLPCLFKPKRSSS